MSIVQTALTFEELQIGQRWLSESRVISLEDVYEFAELTGDRDRLHVDPDFAARGPFGKPVAHGMLGMSILAGLSSTAPFVKTAALVDIRGWVFLKPLFPGDAVHVVTEIADLKPHGRRHGEVHWYRQLINQKGEKVQEGILVTLVARMAPLTIRPVRNSIDRSGGSAPYCSTGLERSDSVSPEESLTAEASVVAGESVTNRG
jgi:3-hydroxybutyryl-CoA dehydratase